MITVKVKAFGLLRRRFPSETTLSWPAPITVNELLNTLEIGEDDTEDMMLICDQDILTPDSLIASSCEVIVVTPVCGG